MPHLQGNRRKECHDAGQTEAGASTVGSAGNDKDAAGCGAERAGAGGHGNGAAGGDGGVAATAGGASDSRDRGDGDDINATGGACGEVDLGHGHAGVDDNGGAGARDHLTGVIGAGHDGGGLDNDGGVDRGDGRRGSDSDVGGHGGVGGDAGILVNPLSADALEVGNGLGDDLVGLAVGIEAVEDVLNKGGIRAVARGIRVVAAANVEHEGVQAGRDDARAGKSLDRQDRGDGTGAAAVASHSRGSRASRGLGGGTGRGFGGSSRGLGGGSSRGLGGGASRSLGGGASRNGAALDGSHGLSDGADSRRDGDCDNRGDHRVGRAVSDGRLARGDGLGASGEDGRGAIEAGGDGLGDGRSAGRRGLAAAAAFGSNRAGANFRSDRAAANFRSNRAAANFGGLRAAADLRSNRSAADSGGEDGGAADLRSESRAAGTRSSRGAALYRGTAARRGHYLRGDGRDRSSRGGSLGGLGSLGARSSAAVEGDGGNLDGAARLGLVGLGRVNDGDVLGTAALIVDDSSTRLFAGAAMLALRAIGHVVVELEITVELGLDMDGSQGELVDRSPAAERGRVLLV